MSFIVASGLVILFYEIGEKMNITSKFFLISKYIKEIPKILQYLKDDSNQKKFYQFFFNLIKVATEILIFISLILLTFVFINKLIYLKINLFSSILVLYACIFFIIYHYVKTKIAK